MSEELKNDMIPEETELNGEEILPEEPASVMPGEEAEAYEEPASFINSADIGEYVTFCMPSFDEEYIDPAVEEPAGEMEQPEGEEAVEETSGKPAKGKKEEEPEELSIHYLEAGVGEPLLLIHGIGQSLYTWRNLFDRLATSYRVIAIDLPGHGYSSRPEEFAYSMDEVADAIFCFLQEKGIQSAHMMAFSTGALYMMRLITLHPECVANCIAIAPGGISKHMPKLYHRMKNAFGAVFTRNLYTSGDVRGILEDCFVDDSLITPEVVQQYYAPVSDGLTREAMMYSVVNFDMRGTMEDLRFADHEILCVWGREDRLHPASGSVYFQEVLQNGRFYMIKNAGHLVQEELPDRLMEVVTSYIPPAYSYR